MYTYYDHYCANMVPTCAMGVVYIGVWDKWDNRDELKMSKLSQTKLLDAVGADSKRTVSSVT